MAKEAYMMGHRKVADTLSEPARCFKKFPEGDICIVKKTNISIYEREFSEVFKAELAEDLPYLLERQSNISW